MRLIFLAAALGWICNPGASAQMVASNDQVRVEVRVTTDTDEKELKGTSVDTVTQNKSLTIRLTGKAGDPETRIVRWTVFGRNVDSNQLTPIGTADVRLSLDGRGVQVVETPRVSATYTPDHTVVSKSKGKKSASNRGRNQTTTKATRVDGKGTKYAGYSVKVLDGKKVVGEASDPPGIAPQPR